MSVLVPLTFDRLAISLTPRTVIHASTETPLRAMKEAESRRGAVRALCGVDAKLFALGVVGRPDRQVLMPWPPPLIDRCVDCARIDGVGASKRSGDQFWQTVVSQ